MILKYNGGRKLFVYQGIDFATGKAEVDDILGQKWIEDSNGTFTLWESPKPTPVVKATPSPNKPAAKKVLPKKVLPKKVVKKK